MCPGLCGPAASPVADRLNTVERVRLSGASVPAGAALSVRVTCTRMRSSLLGSSDGRLPQRWAVAVIGHFSGTLASRLNPATAVGPQPSPVSRRLRC